MIKLNHILCDRCKKTCNSLNSTHLTIPSIKMVQKNGGRFMHFCEEKCRLIFIKGRKYFIRKMKYIAKFKKVE